MRAGRALGNVSFVSTNQVLIGVGVIVYSLAPQTGNANVVTPSPAEQTLFAAGLDAKAGHSVGDPRSAHW